MAKTCEKCGGSMIKVEASDAHRASHGGLHAAQHGMKGGHPAWLVLGLASIAMSAFMTAWKCIKCGHIYKWWA